MKVKIAVTDANIFIDLYDLGLTKYFFNLDLEIHTTFAVLYELYPEQQEILQAYQSVGRLEVHNLQEQDFVEIHNENYPKSLSEAEKSVLHVANKINASVLNSDKVLRNCAKNKDIEYRNYNHNGYYLCKVKLLKNMKLRFAPVINVATRTT